MCVAAKHIFSEGGSEAPFGGGPVCVCVCVGWGGGGVDGGEGGGLVGGGGGWGRGGLS